MNRKLLTLPIALTSGNRTSLVIIGIVVLNSFFFSKIHKTNSNFTKMTDRFYTFVFFKKSNH